MDYKIIISLVQNHSFQYKIIAFGIKTHGGRSAIGVDVFKIPTPANTHA